MPIKGILRKYFNFYWDNFFENSLIFWLEIFWAGGGGDMVIFVLGTKLFVEVVCQNFQILQGLPGSLI